MVTYIPWVWLFALLLVGSPFVYLIGRLGRKSSGSNPAQWAALIAVLGTWVAFAKVYTDFQANGALRFFLGTISMRLDGVTLLLSAAVLALGTLVILFSGPYLKHDAGQEKFYALLIAMMGSMIGLSCADDLFNLWVWFEAMAISSYMLVAYYKDVPSSLEAGVKYLVQSAVGSTFVLMGIALVYSQTGVTELSNIRLNAPESGILWAAGALFIIGFGVKVAMVPLHTWLPDAHSQAPSGISAMLSGVVIEAGLIALLRALGALAFTSNQWGPILLGFGALNMLVGNMMALRQPHLKRMLAYSSLAHVGYILVGIGTAVAFGSLDGAQGAMFHIFNHALMKGLAFLAAGCFLYALYVARGSHQPLAVDDLAGAAKRYPLAAFALAVAVLALGGLPPLNGFMSKWQIFVAGFKTTDPWMIALVIFAAINSVFSMAYYARVVNIMYRKEPSAVVQAGASIPWQMAVPLVILVLAVVILGVLPNLANGLTFPAGLDLLATFGG